MHIPDDPLYYEKYYFTPGDLGFRCFDTTLRPRSRALVCWDQWYPEARAPGGPRRRAGALLPDRHRLAPLREGGVRRRAARRLAHHPARPRHRQRLYVARRQSRRATRARRSTASSSGAARSSPTRSAWSSPKASHDKEEILIVECDPRRIEEVRRNWPFLRDRRIDAYVRHPEPGDRLKTRHPARPRLPHARRVGAARGHLDRLAAQSRRTGRAASRPSPGSTPRSSANSPPSSASAFWCTTPRSRTQARRDSRKSRRRTSTRWSSSLPDQSRLDARLRADLRRERARRGRASPQWRFNAWAKYDDWQQDAERPRVRRQAAEAARSFTPEHGARRRQHRRQRRRACCSPPRSACSARCRRAIPG